MAAFREMIRLTPAEIALYDDIMCLLEDYKACDIDQHEIIGDRPAGTRLVEMELQPTFCEIASLLYTEVNDFGIPLDFETDKTDDGIFISEDPDGWSDAETAANLIRILKWHDLPKSMSYISMPNRRDAAVGGGIILIAKAGVSFMPLLQMEQRVLLKAKTENVSDIQTIFPETENSSEAA